MHLLVLGPLVLTDAAGTELTVARRERRVLEVLAAAAPQSVPAAQLVEALYGDDAPPSAANQVQGCVSRIRRAAGEGPSPVEHTAGSYRLSDAVGLDLLEYESHARAARDALDSGDTEAARVHLATALSLWRGEPFPDAAPGTAVAGLAAKLHRTHLSLREHFWSLQAATDPTVAVAELERLVEENPLRESAWAALMTVLFEAGRQAEAVDTFGRLRSTLQQELGTNPSPAVTALHERILRGDLSTARGEAPPIDALPALPHVLAERTELRAAVTAHLPGVGDPDGRRVVLLHGQEGIGKRNLAIRLGHELRPAFPGGVLYVDVRGYSTAESTPTAVLGELLTQVGLPRHDLPASAEERRDRLAAALAARQALVVLVGVPDEAFAEAVLPGGPLQALVTSRRPAPALGAQHFTVGPLHPPESLAFLRQALGAARVDSQQVQALGIARACGHQPLALHVIAGRLRAHPDRPLQVMLDRLGGPDTALPQLAQHGVELQRGIESQLDDLAPAVQDAFVLLPLFSEISFPGWAVGALAGQKQWAWVVDALVEAHLLMEEPVDAVGQVRYTMPPLTRAVAMTRWDDLGHEVFREAVGRVARACWVLIDRAAQDLPPSIFDPQLVAPGRTVPPIEMVLDAATERALADGRAWLRAERMGAAGIVGLAAEFGWADLAAHLASTLAPFYDFEWLHEDWQRVTGDALQAVEAERAGGATDLEETRAELLRLQAQLLLYRSRQEPAEHLATEAMDAFAAAGNADGAALCRLILVTATREMRRRADAGWHALQAEQSQNPRIRAAARAVLGGLVAGAGRFPEAVELYEQAIADAVAGQDDHRLALAVRGRGIALSRMELTARAEADLHRAITLFEEMDDPRCLAQALRSLVMHARRMGKPELEEAAQARYEAWFAAAGLPGAVSPYDVTVPRTRPQ